MIKKLFIGVILVALSLYTVFAIMSDDKQLSWYGFFAWLVVGFYVWKFERKKIKALEASKLQALQNRVAHLARQLDELPRR
jgi:hypothetical protein